MFHKIDQIKKMFSYADAFIKEHPNYINMDVNEIFDALSCEEYGDMTHTRWGVMTRAAMKNLCAYDDDEIMRFVSELDYKWDALTENIAYVLFFEKRMDALALLEHAVDMGSETDILPYVSETVKYVKDCRLSAYDKIADALKHCRDSAIYNRFVFGYAEALVNNQNEKEMLALYAVRKDEETRAIAYEMAKPLCATRLADAEKAVDWLFKTGKKRCVRMAAEYLYRCSLHEIDCISKYGDVVEDYISKDADLRQFFVPVFMEAVLAEADGYADEYSKKASEIAKNGTFEEKRSIVLSLQYRFRDSENAQKILNDLIIGLSKDEVQLIFELDYYLAEKIKRNGIPEVLRLVDLYDICAGDKTIDFLDRLPQVRMLLSKCDEFIEIWIKKMAYGNNTEFSFMMEAYNNKLVTTTKILDLCKNNELTDDEIDRILMGIYLFSSDSAGLIRLIFGVSDYIGDKELLVKRYLDDVYANYPADLCEYAESIEKDNTNQYYFALKVLEKHAGENEKKSAIAGDADFRQPMAHRAVDFKIAMDRNNRINQMAEEKSLFSRYFPKRMMKYGSKIGFFRETHSRKKEYLESDYGSFNAKVSLPIRFLSDPIDYYQRRENYLKDRLRNYEADC